MGKTIMQNTITPSKWEFIIYTAGDNLVSQRAKQQLINLCDHYASDNFTIHEINILQKPTPPLPPDLLAIPTVVRTSPLPERRVVGDLSELNKAAQGLGFLETTLL
jgi:circadian clock protein KaiB